MTATFYIVSGMLDKPSYLSSDDVVELSRSFLIGSHSHTHYPGWPIKPSDREIVDEAILSKKILENLIKRDVFHHAWPYGYTTVESTELLMRSNFKSGAIISSRGKNDGSLFEIYRINVDGSCTVKQFIQMLERQQEIRCDEDH